MNAAAVTFYSQRLLDRALELGLMRPRLSVVYPPVSESFVARDPVTRADWRRELGISEPLVVLNVKRLHELAGQRYLIEAFARVARRRPDVRLIICGTGPLKQDLEERASVLGVGAKVTFTGLVANDLVARYAAVADAFVLPSLLEALPTVAVEALAAGTPVISADHPGGLELNEIFGDDVSIVPRRNADALADRLEDALRSPRRTRASTGALVRNRFSPAAVRGGSTSAAALQVRQVRRVRQVRGTRLALVNFVLVVEWRPTFRSAVHATKLRRLAGAEGSCTRRTCRTCRTDWFSDTISSRGL